MVARAPRHGALVLLLCLRPAPSHAAAGGLREPAAPTPERGLQAIVPAAGTYRQRLKNSDDVSYTAEVHVGWQSLSAVLDTGSHELLVFSTQCQSCGDSPRLFNPSASRSFVRGQLLSMQSFGSGTAATVEAFDDVAVGPLRSSNQSFWEVYEADMPVLQHGDIQAIFGVGPPETPELVALRTAQETAAMQKWYEEHSRRPPAALRREARHDLALAQAEATKQTFVKAAGINLFSVCFGRDQGSEGYFIWNDAALASQRSAFNSMKVIGNVTWGLPLASPEVVLSDGNGTVPLGCENGCAAILDSGTSLMVMPTEVVSRLATELSKLGQDCDSLDKMPHIRFKLGDVAHSIPPQAYLGQTYGVIVSDPFGPSFQSGQALMQAVCRLELLVIPQDVQTSAGALWIVGMPFFREYYTTFELGGDSNANRFVHTASPGDNCEAQAGGAESGAKNKRPYPKVDLSKVRAPHWIIRAPPGNRLRI